MYRVLLVLIEHFGDTVKGSQDSYLFYRKSFLMSRSYSGSSTVGSIYAPESIWKFIVYF